MGTKGDAYDVLVKEKARRLEQVVGHAVGHGREGACPNCGHTGLYDLQGSGLSAASIYFSITDESWRCMICDMAFTGY